MSECHDITLAEVADLTLRMEDSVGRIVAPVCPLIAIEAARSRFGRG